MENNEWNLIAESIKQHCESTLPLNALHQWRSQESNFGSANTSFPIVHFDMKSENNPTARLENIIIYCPCIRNMFQKWALHVLLKHYIFICYHKTNWHTYKQVCRAELKSWTLISESIAEMDLVKCFNKDLTFSSTFIIVCDSRMHFHKPGNSIMWEMYSKLS